MKFDFFSPQGLLSLTVSVYRDYNCFPSAAAPIRPQYLARF